jgi:kynurenine formamidase
MNYIYLSYGLTENSPVYKGLENISIIHNSTIPENGYNTHIISLENHSGTHVDAPAHFLEDGKCISEYGVEELIFDKVLFIEIPRKGGEEINVEDLKNTDKILYKGVDNVKKGLNYKLAETDFLIIRTGFYKYRQENSEKYLTQNPGLNPDLIEYLRENFPSIRAIGMDCISVSSFGNPDIAIKTHQNAFIKSEKYGEPLLLVEDMDLSAISTEDGIKKLFLIPWQIEGVDSAPCTVIVEV